MKPIRVLIILSALFGGTAARAKAETFVVKTNHEDVNLWSAPGRVDSDQIDVVKQYEEVLVTGKPRKLANGQTWYPVLLRRLPDWRTENIRGWVDSKFFDRLGVSTPDEAVTDAQNPRVCKNCRKQLPRLPVPKSVKQDTSNSGFQWPVGGRLSSGFGMRRHPVHGTVKQHGGIDIAGNALKTVRAAKAGKVLHSSRICRNGYRNCNGGRGNYVEIMHANGVKTIYMHLDPSCKIPAAGTKVNGGDPIACVGKTGTATGYHLHFGVEVKGKLIDPLRVLPPRRS